MQFNEMFSDDGTAPNTEAVLDILKEKEVHATFFINGDNFDSINDPQTHEKLRRIIREVMLISAFLLIFLIYDMKFVFQGHQIGSHVCFMLNLLLYKM